jgi:hypothetical protein
MVSEHLTKRPRRCQLGVVTEEGGKDFRATNAHAFGPFDRTVAFPVVGLRISLAIQATKRVIQTSNPLPDDLRR